MHALVCGALARTRAATLTPRQCRLRNRSMEGTFDVTCSRCALERGHTHHSGRWDAQLCRPRRSRIAIATGEVVEPALRELALQLRLLRRPLRSQ
eukprot:4918666-Prymnesium_polylepis.1